LVRHSLEDGVLVCSQHFRQALANEGLDFEDALLVLRSGRVYEEAEPDIRTGEWKYRIEGYEPGGKWLVIVLCFKEVDRALLVTVFSVASRSRR